MVPVRLIESVVEQIDDWGRFVHILVLNKTGV